ncbi:MAG: YgaP family membrane protein [Pseudohaliea sp.]
MTIERLVLAFAGTFILLSLVLAHFVHPGWLWFTAFVGANLLQSAFTGFCPLAVVLRRLGRQSGPAFPSP